MTTLSPASRTPDAARPVPQQVSERPPFGIEYLPNPGGNNLPGQVITYAVAEGDVVATGPAGEAKAGARSWIVHGTTAADDAVRAATELLKHDRSIPAIAWGPIPTEAPQYRAANLHLFEVDAPADVVDSLNGGDLQPSTRYVPYTTEGGAEGSYNVHAAFGFVSRNGRHDVPAPAPTKNSPYTDGGSSDYGYAD